MTFDELVSAGGPRALIDAAARNGAEREARFWLDAVRDMRTRMGPDDIAGALMADGYIKEIRRILHERQSLAEARAVSRERVRRHRERRRAMSGVKIDAKPRPIMAPASKPTRKAVAAVPARLAAGRARMLQQLGPEKLGNAAAAVRFLLGRGDEPTPEAISELMGMPADVEALRAQGQLDRIRREVTFAGSESGHAGWHIILSRNPDSGILRPLVQTSVSRLSSPM
jgi:hypothetical protein